MFPTPDYSKCYWKPLGGILYVVMPCFYSVCQALERVFTTLEIKLMHLMPMAPWQHWADSS